MNGKPRRVIISGEDFVGQVSIALIRREGGKRWVEHYAPDIKKWSIIPIDQGSPGPTITLDGDDAVELYLELHAYFSARGVKNKDESFTAGELAGTRKHLEDLRTLLKLRAT